MAGYAAHRQHDSEQTSNKDELCGGEEATAGVESRNKRGKFRNLLPKLVTWGRRSTIPSIGRGTMPNPITVYVYEAHELIALEFKTLEGFRACVRTYVAAQPHDYFAAPGRTSVIVPKIAEPWLGEKLRAAGHEYSLVPVGSMGDLPAEKAGQLRRRRGQPRNPELRTLEGAKAFLKRLKEEGVQAALHSD